MRGAGRLHAHLCLDLAGFLGKFVAVPEVGVIAKKAPRGRNTTSSCSPPAPPRPAPMHMLEDQQGMLGVEWVVAPGDTQAQGHGVLQGVHLAWGEPRSAEMRS